MLTKTRKLIEALNSNSIRYCHWKSNFALAESLMGQTDIDLLVDRQDANLFRTILTQLCFRPALMTDGEAFPSVEHYYALDENCGVLIHVHAYFRVITGESLTKNYQLPIEDMLLQNTRVVDSIPVPVKSAELVVFTVRMMLKHTSLVELVLLARYWQQVQQEAEWLLDAGSIDETLSFVEGWLPSLDTDLFSACVAALTSPTPLGRRIILGHRLRLQLRPYARHSVVRAWLSGLHKFTAMLFRRLTRSQKGMVPQRGGALIAFVGSEATGKSTLLAEMNRWLGEHFAVEQIHVGKPPSTTLSVLPNVFVPALRALLPTLRSTYVTTQHVSQESDEKSPREYPLVFAIRSVLLAYDRRALLSRAAGHVANGTIVFCDRYPSLVDGAPDSPQLSHILSSSHGDSVRRILAQIEARLYQEMPAPDLIIYLTAPLEVTVSRNAGREKTEPEEYVRRRHALTSNLDFGKTPMCKINTDRPFDRTVLEAKNAIWDAL